MESDSHFEIGSSHEVCQDYALTQAINDNLSLAIVTDGCTMSHDQCGQADLGARVVAHAAKDVLNRSFKDRAEIKEDEDEMSAFNQFFREKVIITAKMIERHIDLHPMFADCTLLAAVVGSNKKANVLVYGDGNIYVKYETGDYEIIDITFLSGAPFYLSYQTDPDRKRRYMEQYGDSPILIDSYIYREDGELITKRANQKTVKDSDLYDKMTFSFQGIEFISLMSDGVKSFLKKDGGDFKPVDYNVVINELNAFKNKSGVYVQRRMKSVAKTHMKDDVKHTDDISLASVVIGK